MNGKVITLEIKKKKKKKQTELIQEEINVENWKRIMSKKKIRLPSLRKQEWKTVKAKTEK